MLAALLRAGFAPVHVYEEDSEMARMKGPWWNNLVAEKHHPLPPQLEEQIAAVTAYNFRQHNKWMTFTTLRIFVF